ncbi:MAG TPA: hypothetical protein VKB88_05605 [Bryobacteraceae bacterium]|nr:hypothetical protein [Bryobacteraceae bacterium]
MKAGGEERRLECSAEARRSGEKPLKSPLLRVSALNQQLVYWSIPPLLLLLVHGWCFRSWFRADDFAWLGLLNSVHSFHDLVGALFSPQAQGTIRPWSERGFFMVGRLLFGLNVWPYRIVIFATAFADLALVAAIGRRLSSLPAAGFFAAIFWSINSTSTEPLGWTCVYNEVMCALFLLLAFYCLLRYIETGHTRWYVWQWIVFLLGFGALELNVVYPALAAAYATLCARKVLARTLALAPVSVAYFFLHNALAPPPHTGDYSLHYGGPMIHSLQVFWAWSVGPTYMATPLGWSKGTLQLGVSLITVVLGAFLWRKVRERRYAALFTIVWYLIVIAPVLPLSRHLTEYYPYIPAIGLCWLGGWAFAEAWRSATGWRILATALAALYVVLVLPQTLAAGKWNYVLTQHSRHLVESLAGIHQRHPGKGILLIGVDGSLFWNAIRDGSYKLVGIDHLYLPPGSEKLEATDPSWSGAEDFTIAGTTLRHALQHEDLEVYDVRGPRLRNITTVFASMPIDLSLPRHLTAGDPAVAEMFGPEWYSIEVDHRWMPRRATFKIGGPQHAGEHLYLHGYVSDDQLNAGPVEVTATVDGSPLPTAPVTTPEFELLLPLPDSAAGKPEIHVTLDVNRTIRPPADGRELGIAFGDLGVK